MERNLYILRMIVKTNALLAEDHRTGGIQLNGQRRNNITGENKTIPARPPATSMIRFITCSPVFNVTVW